MGRSGNLDIPSSVHSAVQVSAQGHRNDHVVDGMYDHHRTAKLAQLRTHVELADHAGTECDLSSSRKRLFVVLHERLDLRMVRELGHPATDHPPRPVWGSALLLELLSVHSRNPRRIVLIGDEMSEPIARDPPPPALGMTPPPRQCRRHPAEPS